MRVTTRLLQLTMAERFCFDFKFDKRRNNRNKTYFLLVPFTDHKWVIKGFDYVGSIVFGYGKEKKTLTRNPGCVYSLQWRTENRARCGLVEKER